MKNKIILLTLVICSSVKADIITFSPNSVILPTDINQNFNEIKQIVINKKENIIFKSFESGKVISASEINIEANKLSIFGITTPPLINGPITAQDMNGFFQAMKIASLAIEDGIKNVLGVRTYFDGTLASSCLDYKTRNIGRYFYGTDTGSGIYKIKLYDNSEQLVYCDMVTDGGGWTQVLRQNDGAMAHTVVAGINVNRIHLRDINSKLHDQYIKSIARAGQREAYINHKNLNKAIYRYSDSVWNSYATNGWTNVSFDSKSSNGNWTNNACNGHFNNRGFSTWNDRSNQTCYVVYSGSRFYYTNYHVDSWANITDRNPVDIYVR